MKVELLSKQIVASCTHAVLFNNGNVSKEHRQEFLARLLQVDEPLQEFMSDPMMTTESGFTPSEFVQARIPYLKKHTDHIFPIWLQAVKKVTVASFRPNNLLRHAVCNAPFRVLGFWLGRVIAWTLAVLTRSV